jgi:hypothetical protein
LHKKTCVDVWIKLYKMAPNSSYCLEADSSVENSVVVFLVAALI